MSKREPTSFSKLTDNYCTLSLEFINLLHNFDLAVIEYLYPVPRWLAVGSLTFEIQLHAAGAQLALVTLNK